MRGVSSSSSNKSLSRVNFLEAASVFCIRRACLLSHPLMRGLENPCGEVASYDSLIKRKMLDWKEHITTDEAILNGKPIISGTRLSVEFILERLANGWTEAEILENYKSPSYLTEKRETTYSAPRKTILQAPRKSPA